MESVVNSNLIWSAKKILLERVLMDCWGGEALGSQKEDVIITSVEGTPGEAGVTDE